MHDDVLQEEFPGVFGTCIVTRAQAHKFRDTVDQYDSFLFADNSVNAKKDVGTVEVEVCTLPCVDLPIGKPMLIEAQRADQTLSRSVMTLSHVFIVSILPSCVLSVYVHVCVSDGRFLEIICWRVPLVLNLLEGAIGSLNRKQTLFAFYLNTNKQNIKCKIVQM